MRELASRQIKELIERIDYACAHLLAQPKWYSTRYCDDVAIRLLEAYPDLRAELKFHVARSKPLAAAVDARLRGLTLDTVEERYVDERAPQGQPRERDRIKVVLLGGATLEAAEALGRVLWKEDKNGRRQRRRAPRAVGLLDLVHKQTGSPRLIPAKPLGETLKTALSRLTPKQRVVYQGRVLDEPRRSLAALAAELQVSRKRVVVLEHRARELMAQFLRGR
jgi:hypothetical protein